MVNLHFLSLMEALLECRSTILAKLMPLWCPVLHAYNIQVRMHNVRMVALKSSFQLPDHICDRLQSIQDATPPESRMGDERTTSIFLMKWLQRLQFKMGQIELQASNATQQFFTV